MWTRSSRRGGGSGPTSTWGALALLGRLFRTAHLADAALAKPLAGPRAPAGLVRPAGALRRAGEPYTLKPTQLMQTMLLSSRGMTKRLDVLPTPAWSNAAQTPTTAEAPS